MKHKMKNVIPVFETQVDVTIVEEDGSYYIYMDKEFINEVINYSKVSLWRFHDTECLPFDFLEKDLVENKFRISKKTINHEGYPINAQFPLYRSFQRYPPPF